MQGEREFEGRMDSHVSEGGSHNIDGMSPSWEGLSYGEHTDEYRTAIWQESVVVSWMNGCTLVEGTNLQGRTNLSVCQVIVIHHSPRRSWRPTMPYTYNALPYHANALSFSPYNDSLISVASSQNYGLVGNGKVLILQLSPSGITALNSYRFVSCVLTYQQVWYARRDIRHSLERSSWEPTSRCVWRLFNQTIWHNT